MRYKNYTFTGTPAKFDKNDLIRTKQAVDIWKHDAAKIDDLISNGYEIMIVWESEYKLNPNVVLYKCKEFLT